jgi:hypothetical protein
MYVKINNLDPIIKTDEQFYDSTSRINNVPALTKNAE